MSSRPPRNRRPRFTLGRAQTPQPGQLPQLPPLPWRRIGRIAAAVGIAAAVMLGGWWLWAGDTLRVNTVIVVGTEVVDANEVAAAAQLHGDSMLTLDKDAAGSRIQALPGVHDVSVERDFPRTVVITVHEEQAWGYWQAGGVRAVVDAEGRVLERARPPAEGAPTVYETGGRALQPGDSADRDTVTLITRLLSDGTFQRLGTRPARFEFDRGRGLTIRVADGPAAVFGDSHNYEFKVAAWAALVDRINNEQIAAGEVDLRFGRELVVR